MKSVIIILAAHFLFLANAFAYPFEEFRGHWQGKGTNEYHGQVADCDFDIEIYRMCETGACDGETKFQITQTATQCVPRDGSQPYSYTHPVWAYFRFSNDSLIDAQPGAKDDDIVGRYVQGSASVDGFPANCNLRFWLSLNSDGSINFHETALSQPWEAPLSAYSAVLQRAEK